MPDVFISYTSPDERIARFVHQHLEAERVTSFLACVSLQPGAEWTPEVFRQLNAARWVLVLASRAANNSAFVQQEVGLALAANKTVVPIVWDMAPTELPGWLAQRQALDLANRTYEDLRVEVVQIAQRIKQEQLQGLLAIGLLLAGVAAFSRK
jgi:hypothetical protein